MDYDTEKVDELALDAIRAQIKSPQWREMVRPALEGMRDGEAFRATYHVWTIPGFGKEIAPAPYFAQAPGRLQSLKYVAGAGLEPATYSL